MLKQRFLTAIFLIPLILVIIFFLPPEIFLIIASLVVLAAAWEWAQLAGIQKTWLKIVYLIVMLIFLVVLVWDRLPLPFSIAAGVIFWIIALLLTFLYPRATNYWSSVLVRSFMGLFALGLFWLAAIILQGMSAAWFLFALIIIWGADAGAFFVGKKWGNQKLLPSVSPGKTVAGFMGGLVSVFLIGILGLWIFDISADDMVLFLLICVLGGGVITVIGDLFESMLKRYRGLKDSGNLLPGHGGLLDRIDSLMPAIPFFALFFPYVMR